MNFAEPVPAGAPWSALATLVITLSSALNERRRSRIALIWVSERPPVEAPRTRPVVGLVLTEPMRPTTVPPPPPPPPQPPQLQPEQDEPPPPLPPEEADAVVKDWSLEVAVLCAASEETTMK